MFNLYFASIPSPDYGVTKFLYNQYDDRSKIKNLYDELIKPSNRVFLDCGAFPAYTRGITVNIDDYIDYINNNADMFTVVASLDVIPTGNTKQEIECAAVKSWDNFLYMRERVVCKEKLIPTFHQTEPIKYLRNILEFTDVDGRVNYFALGALTNITDYNCRVNFISECFNLISSVRPDIKVHAFGMTDLKILELFPFYSADSTAYVLAAGMGEIITKFGRVAVSNLRFGSKRYLLNAEQNVELLKDYVAGFGFDLLDLARSREERIKFYIRYLQDWEQHRVCMWDRNGMRRRLF